VPDEGFGIVVPMFGPDFDGFDEVGHGGEHAAGVACPRPALTSGTRQETEEITAETEA
jgi:hypothetical protein